MLLHEEEQIDPVRDRARLIELPWAHTTHLLAKLKGEQNE